jgi:hypothetical protein
MQKLTSIVCNKVFGCYAQINLTRKNGHIKFLLNHLGVGLLMVNFGVVIT